MSEYDDNVAPIDGESAAHYDAFQGMTLLFDEPVGLFPIEVIEMNRIDGEPG